MSLLLAATVALSWFAFPTKVVSGEAPTLWHITVFRYVGIVHDRAVEFCLLAVCVRERLSAILASLSQMCLQLLTAGVVGHGMTSLIFLWLAWFTAHRTVAAHLFTATFSHFVAAV